jgi:hypothetical protein
LIPQVFLRLPSAPPARRRALAPLALLAALAFTAGAAEAQRIPGLPGTGQRPQPQQQTPRTQRPVEDDTTRAAAQPDSLYDRLKALEGFTPVEYQGDSAEFYAGDRILRLFGTSQVQREGTRLDARDSIVYRERREFVEVYGSPRVQGEGNDIAGDVMYYHLGTRRARVLGAETTITDGATWFVRGNVTSEEGERIYAERSTFTSDDRDEPAYHFRAGRIKVVRNRVLVGRPAVLYFRNVPVMALPFIVQDLERGRRSGLLVPRFELNDIVRTNSTSRERGTGRQLSNVGYYWAINNYLGAEVAGEWRSDSWTALSGNLQFNWRRRFLQGNARFTNYWRAEGVRNTNVMATAGWQPDERTTLAANVDWRQDAGFERDRSLNPWFQSSDISSTVSLQRRMDWGTVSAGAERRQSIADGDLTLSPNVSLNFNPITLFPARDGDGSWYNDATLTVGGTGSLRRLTGGQDAVLRRVRDTEDVNGAMNLGIRFGQLGVSSSASYTRAVRSALPAPDPALIDPTLPAPDTTALPRSGEERLTINAGTGYQINLIGSTRLTPNVSFSQMMGRAPFPAQPDTLVPDTLAARAYDRFIAGPPRVNFTAGLNTELFGFFPGFGEYSGIRHHLQPSFSYAYTPRVAQDTIQSLVFGRFGGREVNELRLTLNQTFEGKLRPRQTSAADTAAVVAAAAELEGEAVVPGTQGPTGGQADSGPEQVRKVNLLSISTSALAYNFAPLDTLGYRFTTPDISNSIRSDLFGGLSFDIAHSLFEERSDGDGTRRVRGRFSPFLTSANTSFRLDGNSAVFRWLGGLVGGSPAAPSADQQEPPLEEGGEVQAPNQRGENGFASETPRVGGFSEMGQTGGPWSLALSYSMNRSRPDALSRFPQQYGLRDNQELRGTLNFSPTRNWSVGWNTAYSLTTGEFSQHVLNLRRDLYRWQANFNFARAPNGNTMFSFEVHLQDLPDLKADWREQNLGGRRTP